MAEFSSNPNQRKIIVNKEKTDNKDPKNYYARFNLIALKNAMHSLSTKAFELWIYIAKNNAKENEPYSFYLSKVDFLNWSNVKSTSYYSAFDELVQGRYLIPIDTYNAEPKKYNFYEIPKAEEKDELIEITINNTEFLF